MCTETGTSVDFNWFIFFLKQRCTRDLSAVCQSYKFVVLCLFIFVCVCAAGSECAVCDFGFTARVPADDRPWGGIVSVCDSPWRVGGSAGRAHRGTAHLQCARSAWLYLPLHFQNPFLWVRTEYTHFQDFSHTPAEYSSLYPKSSFVAGTVTPPQWIWKDAIKMGLKCR